MANGTGRLEGKVAVITGAASGIGRATTQLFVDEGCKVVVADLQEDVGAAFAAELGDQATFVSCNVVNEDEVAAAVSTAVDEWGRLDAVYANAGFVGATGPMESITSDDYDKTMNVLLRGVFYTIKHAAPIMREQQSGSMIATASVCGLEAGIGAHIYTVAKAGVISMMESMALEMAEHGVRSNSICPGYIATSLMAGRMRSQVDDDETARRLDKSRDIMGQSQPMHRVGEPDDIANMALFLASDDSEWVTGTAQVVDGGLIVGKPWRKQPKGMTEARPITMYDV
ncbi:MAG: glucose 1-dehydrogenase [Actinomycetota bacterium]|jgi:NAD(P)-dependent dehydrogenase (short-subunit alcohol dehydrogenase family)|nr:glucose 1-dehydrogenase [Actinomycetota bacterium]